MILMKDEYNFGVALDFYTLLFLKEEDIFLTDNLHNY